MQENNEIVECILDYHKVCQIFLSYHMCLYKNKIILFPFGCKYLFVFDKNVNIFKKYSFSDEPENYELFDAFDVVGDELFLAPCSAHEFYTINISSGRKTIINGILSDEEKRIKEKFIFVIKQENNLWIIGEKLHKVFCLDINNGYKVIYKYDYSNEDNELWTHGYLIKDGKGYFPSRKRNRLLIIDFKIRNAKIIDVGKDTVAGFCAIYEENGRIILVANDCNKYFLEDDSVSFGIEPIVIWRVLESQGKIFKIARNKAEIYVKENNGTENIIQIDDYHGEKASAFWACLIFLNEIFIQLYDGRLFCINTETYRSKEIMIQTEESKDLYKEHIKNVLMNKSMEEKNLGLKELLYLLSDNFNE